MVPSPMSLLEERRDLLCPRSCRRMRGPVVVRRWRESKGQECWVPARMIGWLKRVGLEEEMIAGMGLLRVVLLVMVIGWMWIVVGMAGGRLKGRFGIKRRRLRKLCVAFGGDGNLNITYLVRIGDV